MNLTRLSFFLILLVGCGARQESVDSSAPAKDAAPAKVAQESAVTAPVPAAQGEVTDDKIGLPPYPGATEVEQSRVSMHTGTGDSYSVYYMTTDSPAQVAAFYQAEGAKVGTLKESINLGEQLKSVGIDRTDGTVSGVQARTDGKGKTVISLHRLFPAKK